MTSSNGNIFRVTGPLCVEFTVTVEFAAQRPVMQSFDVFLDICLNKWLSKQLWGWWLKTLSHSLWRHCNVITFAANACTWFKFNVRSVGWNVSSISLILACIYGFGPQNISHAYTILILTGIANKLFGKPFFPPNRFSWCWVGVENLLCWTFKSTVCDDFICHQSKCVGQSLVPHSSERLVDLSLGIFHSRSVLFRS